MMNLVNIVQSNADFREFRSRPACTSRRPGCEAGTRHRCPKRFGPTTKAEIALALIDELRGDAEPNRPVAVESGYLSVPAFTEGIRTRGLTATANSASAATVRERITWLRAVLGLDHFEGRTWHGWHHHVSLIFAAYQLLASLQLGDDLPPFRSPHAGMSDSAGKSPP